MIALKYRPDIDGLRAVAVLSVVLFHAGFSGASGGFVGVDIFFVISGFLITSLIVKDLEAGTFSFAGFWERRARRILPALAAVVLFCFAAGWFLLLPDDYAALGREAAAQAVFSSNILFYKEAGYFDTASDLKILLHTWTLSLEEQFYIVFPLLFVLAWKKWRHKTALLFGGCIVLSLAVCQIVLRANPELAFYMLPFRAWEFLIGSFMAGFKPVVPGRRGHLLSLAGIASILATIVLYDEETLFPGAAAVLPCLGAAALIAAGELAIVNRLLSLWPVVFVGQVSYSWYLWHWPVMVLAKYVPFFTFDAVTAAFSILLSFVLAVLSWRYVETPFRKFRVLPERRLILRASGVFLAVVVLSGLIVSSNDGIPARLDPAVLHYAAGAEDSNPHRNQCDHPAPDQIKSGDLCQTDAGKPPRFMMWGDSHGDAVAPAFYKLSREYGVNGYIVTRHGCPPFLNAQRQGDEKKFGCLQHNAAVFEFIKQNHIGAVFLVASWANWLHSRKIYFPETGWAAPYQAYDNTAMAALADTIDRLHKARVKVYVMMNVPYGGFDVPRRLALTAMYGLDAGGVAIPRAGYERSLEDGIGGFRRIKADQNIVYLDPASVLCKKDACSVGKDGQSLYFDASHISVFGAGQMAALFEPYFKKGF